MCLQGIWTDGQTDRVIPIYPPNFVCEGYKKIELSYRIHLKFNLSDTHISWKGYLIGSLTLHAEYIQVTIQIPYCHRVLCYNYVCSWQPSWMEVVVTGHNFESILPKDHPCHVCFKLADWFQRRRLLNNFAIGSYVKTMSADGGHFGPRSGSLNTILEVDHLRTIDDMFAILAYWFQRRRF